MKIGRPRKISPQTKEAQKFLELYLDPLQQPEQIRSLCKISLSTYYNYESELRLPQIRAGIGLENADLPRLRALTSAKMSDEIEELEILRYLARCMRVRLKLIPVLSSSYYRIIDSIQSKNVDFLMASVSKTEDLSKTLYFSESYLFNDSPHGYIMKSRDHKVALGLKKQKPSLGVPQKSIHSEFAQKSLAQDYDVRVFKNPQTVFQSIKSGRTDFALLHPAWLGYFPLDSEGIQIESSAIYYKSKTAIVFHPESTYLMGPVNAAIESVYENTSLGRGVW